MSGSSDAHVTRRGETEFLRGGIFSDLQRESRERQANRTELETSRNDSN